MAAIETICLGNLRTEVTHTQSGTKIVTDAPTDNKGKGEYFLPTDLVATALGSCMMTIMDMFAQEHGIDLTGTRIVTEKVMSSNPRRIGEIKIDLYFKGEFTDKQKNDATKGSRYLPGWEIPSSRPDTNHQLSFRKIRKTIKILQL